MQHVPASVGYLVKCEYDSSLDKFKFYRGKNCVKYFINEIRKDVMGIYSDFLSKIIPMLPLTPEETDEYLTAVNCCICEKPLRNDRVRDHDHLSGKYRGVAHNECNLNFQIPAFVPIFFHNFSGYDSHLFLKELVETSTGTIDCIPLNKESYICIREKIKLDTNQIIELRFLDSYRFMGTSLEKLVSTLEPHDFNVLSKHFQPIDMSLLLRKQIFPYEYVDSWSKFLDNELPPKEKFYSELTKENVSDHDYSHAKNIWSHFNLNNLGEYSDLYLKTDILLLADVFENFRKTCFNIYGLDPAQYYTLPGYTWDAMMRFTKVKIELLTNVDMVHFVKKGIRGGISQCSVRYAKANNKYCPDFDSSIPSNFLIYLDANNLYGWSMSQPLPLRNFRFLNDLEISQIDIFTISDDNQTGYILEVDIDYPTHLHEKHNEFPFLVENIVSPIGKEVKLIPNFYSKKKYVTHYRNLKQAVSHGLIIRKIHRVLQFEQSPWLKSYIDINTKKRQEAKSTFEKDTFKLMNNAIYGKTMENVEKYVNVRLVSNWENKGKKFGAQVLIAKPNFHSSSIFSENCVAVQLNKTKVYYNKPIILGFTILDVSKTLMYSFHFDYMLKKYANKVKLMYTDTDSFIYNITTNDFYADIIPDIDSKFDTNDYPENNIYNLPRKNGKKLGLMKDENCGRIMYEFVGLRSKVYAFTVENSHICKVKGIDKSVTKRLLLSDFIKCLDPHTILLKSMNRFRSIHQVVFTQEINKVALSAHDDKRKIEDDSHITLAWGHHRTVPMIMMMDRN